MALTIWKYQLKMTGDQFVYVPSKHEILSLHLQGDDCCMWVKVDPLAEKIAIRIYMFGTGMHVPVNPLVHIGTVQDGMLVWHFFREPT